MRKRRQSRGLGALFKQQADHQTPTSTGPNYAGLDRSSKVGGRRIDSAVFRQHDTNAVAGNSFRGGGRVARERFDVNVQSTTPNRRDLSKGPTGRLRSR